MVEVFGARVREPTGPRRAPRTYPGPVQLQVRRVGPREDVEIASVAQLGGDSKDRGIESRIPFGLTCAPETDTEEGRRSSKLAARNARGAKSEKLPSEEVDPTEQDEAEQQDVSPKAGPLAARFEDKSEPESGSHIKSEAGERNVAERRHGHPCGQQSVDEADGHRPQGAEASRLGDHRRRRCHFRGAGFSDHRQQRSDAQSVSTLALKESHL
ncbi:hypothetical protein X777_13303 [Ooceraea biroi]|uniref:Uncharacterized protein n=1 Tax=Ooceraea biroi TaxID=2015173 RepID=A0A026WVX9_OOCBI|nr:hypothetical protein X777_13303 [Ooceraea biroi]